jgi:hypothetical protein
VGFEVLTAVVMKIPALWDITTDYGTTRRYITECRTAQVEAP